MTTIILFPNDSGGVAVLYPSWRAKLESETDEEFITRIRKKDVPEGLPYIIADTADLPTDRSERDAWQVDFTGAPINGTD